MKNTMKSKIAAIMVAGILTVSFTHSAVAEKRGGVSYSRIGIGIGMVTESIPVSTSNTRIPISTVYYERFFNNPQSVVSSSIDIGFHGFYGILPIPD